jgi:hypothetical protein
MCLSSGLPEELGILVRREFNCRCDFSDYKVCMHVALQIAKLRGACVTAVCGSRNFTMVKELGADHIVCYDTCSDIIDPLLDICSNQGCFHVVFDSVSSDDPRDACYQYETKIRVLNGHRLMQPLPGSMYITLGGHVRLNLSCDFCISTCRSSLFMYLCIKCINMY